MTANNLPLTLRQFAGLPARSAIDPASTALLLIDYQNEYRTGRLPLPGVDAACSNGQRLVAWAAAAGIAVWHVGHHAANPSSPLFAPGSDGAAFMPGLQPQAGQGIVYKALPNAFAGTELCAGLLGQGIKTLLVAGLMTHNCVSSTARAALDLGFAPIVVGDACATRDLPDGAGGVVNAADVHRASLAALADRIAEVFTTEQLLALPLKA